MFILMGRNSIFSGLIAKEEPKQEVKACYQCKGAENCSPDKLDGSEIRTSSALGAKNLYCYTVCKKTSRLNV